MKIVVDIGCITYAGFPEDESVGKLISRFQPQQFYGFDPNPALDAAFIGATCADHPDVEIFLDQRAAWVYDGFIGYVMPPDVVNPLRCYTTRQLTTGQSTTESVPCFDLAKLLRTIHTEGDEIILKLDAEGAEFTLLPHLSKGGEDALLRLLLVEWHNGIYDRPLRCPVEEW